MKFFHCQNGRSYEAHERSCLFCEYCTDVFWDYTNGPYMLICEHPETDDRSKEQAFSAGKCEKFKQSGSVHG